MKTIQCLVVDDEPVARRIIEGYIAELSELKVVGSCANALSAKKILTKKKVDLLFLDLEMPKIKGFPFLRTLINPPTVIITTAHREFALEGYELNVLDYLLKPISLPRFLKAINKYKKDQSQKDQYQGVGQDSNFIYVTYNRKTLRLYTKNIHYIQGMNNYIRIKYQTREIVVYSSMSNILKKLGASFVRVHKSFIINKASVTAFTREVVEIESKKIPIGQLYQDVVKAF